jgi:hypothetical protein
MGWGSLRVWNDDTIAARSGFPPHPHSDMEIITYVRQGAITHKDNLDNAGRTEAGDVQVMSAGTGIAHSEYNVEPAKTRIFQIWILPTSRGAPRTWGAKPFPKGERSGRFVTLASDIDGDTDALTLRSDAYVAGATLRAGEHHLHARPWPPPRAPNKQAAQDKAAARSAVQRFPACLVHGLQGCSNGYVERHRPAYEAPKLKVLIERDGGFILRIDDKGEDSRVCACRAPHSVDDEGAAEPLAAKALIDSQAADEASGENTVTRQALCFFRGKVRERKTGRGEGIVSGNHPR